MATTQELETKATRLAIERRESRWAGSWGDLLVRRLGRLLVSLWILVTITFFTIHLIPGDPVRNTVGNNVPQSIVDARRAALGLDLPLHEQYLNYIGNTLRGQFGTSIISGQPVADLVQQRLGATLELALISFVLTMLIAIPVGMLMAVATRGGRRPALHLGFVGTSIFLSTIPGFLFAVVLVYLFAVKMPLLPIAGRTGWESYILPVVAMTTGMAAIMARIVRAETVAVLGDDYIRTARSKRLAARIVYLRHALPNAITATLTMGGMVLTGMVMGTVLVESVFAWPGLGTVLVQAIQSKDYPVVQALTLLYGAMILVVNLVVDLALGAIDPRSKITRGVRR